MARALSRKNLSEGSRANKVVREIEVSVIEEVKEFGPELQVQTVP